MEIFYTPGSDAPYQPEGFVQGKTDQLLFAEADGWAKCTELLTELPSGFHRYETHSGLSCALLIEYSTYFKISHLKYKSPEPQDVSSDSQRPSIPDQLQYTTPVSKYEDMTTFQTKSNGPEINNRPYDERTLAATSVSSPFIEGRIGQQKITSEQHFSNRQKALITPTPTSDAPAKTLPEHIVAVDNPEQDLRLPPKPPQNSTALQNDRIDTQSSNIPEMTDALQTMMQCEHITQGDTQTQASVNTYSAQNKEVDSHSHDPVSPSKASEVHPPVKTTKPELSQYVRKQLESSKAKLRLAARKLVKSRGQKPQEQVVLCQC